MELKTTEKAGICIMILNGRLDLASGTELKDEIKKLFGENKSMFHLNLNDVEFINSSGLGSLVSIMKEVRLHKGRLTLSNMASYVKEIFEITQLSHIFEIFDTEEDALKSYQSAATH